MFSNTIYQINNKEKRLTPYLTLDLKNKDANTEERLAQIQGFGAYLKSARENDYITGPRDFSVINDNLFFSLYGKTTYFVTYNSKTKKTILHTKLMEDLPNIYVSSGRTNKEVIYSIDMPWLIEHFNENKTIKSDVVKRLKEICNNDDDNPVLLFGSF